MRTSFIIINKKTEQIFNPTWTGIAFTPKVGCTLKKRTINIQFVCLRCR